MRKIIIVIVVGFFALGINSAAASDYPAKTISFIINSSAGGMGDVTGRLIAKVMESILGQPIIPQNVPDAGGAVGLSALAKAVPDGYTITISNPDGVILLPLVQQTTYDERSFAKIGGFVRQEIILLSALDAPYKTFEELIEYTKQNPDTVVIGHLGAVWSELTLKQIALRHKLKWRILPFKGGGEGSAALLGGHIKAAVGGDGNPGRSGCKGRKVEYASYLYARPSR